MKKPRPPRTPYCLCGSLRRWILQQVSPSRYSMYYFSGENRRANAYFVKIKDYNTKLIQYRVERRICSLLEWDILHRGLRMKRREGADNG